MKNIFKDLKHLIESAYKLDKKLANVIMTLRLERETHVPDLMTRIRILPGVAVVAQKDKVARFFDGDAQLQISVKYLPHTEQIYNSVKKIADQIKALPGAKSVAIDSYDKRKITMKGRKLIF
jgi:hypothetical protein